MQRLEAKGKGILVLHDIHARTVDALPTILKELKARGYRSGHLLPERGPSPDRHDGGGVASEFAAEACGAGHLDRRGARAGRRQPDEKERRGNILTDLPVHKSASRIASRKRSRLAGVVHVDNMPKPTTLDIHAVR